MVKNLIILNYDSVRPDYLSCYGSHRVRTPYLDDLAKEGILFERVITAAPWTQPSLLSIISGIYAHRIENGYGWKVPPSKDMKTLFDFFARRKYRIASFVFNKEYVFYGIKNACISGETHVPDIHLKWLEDNYRRPFFIFFQSWRTHFPYGFRKNATEFRKERKRLHKKLREDWANGVSECQSLYIRAIEYASEVELRKLVEFLDRRGILKDTLIIFTSDHGETFGERYKDKSEIVNNSSLHGRLLYEEAVRVPLILYSPHLLFRGIRMKNQVRTVDIFPTILELFEIPFESVQPIDGCSLFSDSQKGVDREAFCTTDISQDSNSRWTEKVTAMSYGDGTWKIIWKIQCDELELYNLITDPNETTNLYKERSDITKKMLKKIHEEHRKIAESNLTSEEIKEVSDRLRALGYL